MLVRKLDVSLPAHVVLHHGDQCPGRSDHQILLLCSNLIRKEPVRLVA